MGKVSGRKARPAAARKEECIAIMRFIGSQMPGLRAAAQPYLLDDLAPEELIGVVVEGQPEPVVAYAHEEMIADWAKALRAKPGDGRALAAQITHRRVGKLQVIVRFRDILMVYPVPAKDLAEPPPLTSAAPISGPLREEAARLRASKDDEAARRCELLADALDANAIRGRVAHA